MNDIIDKLTPLLEKVSVKMGEGGQFAWHVVMKQMYVEAVIGLIQFISGLVIAFAIYKITKFLMKKRQEADTYDKEGYEIAVCIIGLIGGVASVLLISFGIYNAVTHFINPEFYAIEFFINLVK